MIADATDPLALFVALAGLALLWWALRGLRRIDRADLVFYVEATAVAACIAVPVIIWLVRLFG